MSKIDNNRYKNHKAKKCFGQNFLTNDYYLNNIINQINPQNTDHIIEIGPGLGALTGNIINIAKKITAIEIDKDCISYLKKTYISDKLNLIENDVLKLNFLEILEPKNNSKIIGNLPYNISSPLIIKLLPILKKTNCMVFLLQKEVVDRLAASPNTKQYGRLSIITQYFCDVTPLTEIPPEAFSPAPKVQSQLVKFNNPKENKFDVILKDISSLEKVTQIAFNQRRKQIKTSLKPLFSEEQIIKLNINPKLRAENLEIEEYIRLANLI